jgi:hypothetical protein
MEWTGVSSKTMRRKTKFRLAAASSVLLHIAFWFAIIRIAAISIPQPPKETSISVIVMPQQETEGPSAVSNLASNPARLPSVAPAEAQKPVGGPTSSQTPALSMRGAMIIARTILSVSVFARTENRQALADLATLSPEDRIEQICGTEGMEQVAKWNDKFQPDRLVASAQSPIDRKLNRIIAKGAAVRSRNQWYALEFDCTFSPSGGTITNFKFRVGAPIPETQWDELFLER